jgi:hypothetical protein
VLSSASQRRSGEGGFWCRSYDARVSTESTLTPWAKLIWAIHESQDFQRPSCGAFSSDRRQQSYQHNTSFPLHFSGSVSKPRLLAYSCVGRRTLRHDALPPILRLNPAISFLSRTAKLGCKKRSRMGDLSNYDWTHKRLEYSHQACHE